MKQQLSKDQIKQADELANAIHRLCAEADHQDIVLMALVVSLCGAARDLHVDPSSVIANVLLRLVNMGIDVPELHRSIGNAMATLSEIGALDVRQDGATT